MFAKQHLNFPIEHQKSQTAHRTAGDSTIQKIPTG